MGITTLFAIGIGGFFGAISRFLISTYMQKLTGSLFPVGTLTVNVLGSFIIGFLVLYFENIVSPNQKAMLVTGFLGALTTFSTFSYETVTMLQESLYYRALINITLHVILSLAGTIVGIIAFKKIYGGI